MYLFDKSRPDHQLKALVYKLVPGLYHSECDRIRVFNETHNIGSPCTSDDPSEDASHPVEHDKPDTLHIHHERMETPGETEVADDGLKDELAYLAADDSIR